MPSAFSDMWQRLCDLTSRSSLASAEVIEVKRLAHQLGTRVVIERYDLDNPWQGWQPVEIADKGKELGCGEASQKPDMHPSPVQAPACGGMIS